MSTLSERRRARVARVRSISSVPSPCIKVCKLENGYCVGCFRTQDEIRDWTILTDQERKIIMERVRSGIVSKALGISTDGLRKQRQRGKSKYNYEVVDGRVFYDLNSFSQN